MKENNVKCELCDEGFPLRKYMMRHLEKHYQGKIPVAEGKVLVVPESFKNRKPPPKRVRKPKTNHSEENKNVYK